MGTGPEWGAARDALAALHNLAALLRNTSIPEPTLLDLLPELRSSAAVLRGAFNRTDGPDAPLAEASSYGAGRVGELDALLDAIGKRATDREALAVRAAHLAEVLEASADLLALLDRAAAPVFTEVSLELVAREAGRMSGSARGREFVVRFDRGSPDCVVTTDPYLLGPLLSLVLARVREAGVEAPVLRAQSVPQARFLIEAAGAGDDGFPTLAMRVMPWVPPSERVLRRVAERLGVTLELEGSLTSIAFAASGG